MYQQTYTLNTSTTTLFILYYVNKLIVYCKKESYMRNDNKEYKPKEYGGETNNTISQLSILSSL